MRIGPTPGATKRVSVTLVWKPSSRASKPQAINADACQHSTVQAQYRRTDAARGICPGWPRSGRGRSLPLPWQLPARSPLRKPVGWPTAVASARAVRPLCKAPGLGTGMRALSTPYSAAALAARPCSQLVSFLIPAAGHVRLRTRVADAQHTSLTVDADPVCFEDAPRLLTPMPAPRPTASATAESTTAAHAAGVHCVRCGSEGAVPFCVTAAMRFVPANVASGAGNDNCDAVTSSTAGTQSQTSFTGSVRTGP
jgi:hypothetical protein